MNKNIKVKNIVVKCGADIFLPVGLMLGFYIIFHGHLSPGGGFQGGVLVASSVILVYLGYGFDGIKKVFNSELIRKNESIGAIMYTFFGALGLFYGYNFCKNVLYKTGNPGDLYSSGTIFWMSISVGYKVLTGVGFLMLLMVGLLKPESEDEKKVR